MEKDTQANSFCGDSGGNRNFLSTVFWCARLVDNQLPIDEKGQKEIAELCMRWQEICEASSGSITNSAGKQRSAG